MEDGGSLQWFLRLLIWAGRHLEGLLARGFIILHKAVQAMVLTGQQKILQARPNLGIPDILNLSGVLPI
jgi:hypothetical protein